MESPPEKDEYGIMSKLWRPLRDEVYEFLTENHIPMFDGALIIDETLHSPLVECHAVATGTMLIHRSVLETMERPWWEYRAGGASEDMQFCYEARNDYGIPIFCDLSTISGHYIFSPQGQAQFRLQYEKRGALLSGYSKREAMKLLSEFLSIPIELAEEKINQGNAHMVGSYWDAKFHKQAPTEAEIKDFYRDSYTGQLYLIELLHWNFSETFFNIKSLFSGLRKKNVLEIGAGIGSVALQLAIQNNKVTAVEPNETLREFIKLRIAKIKKEVTTELGDIKLVVDKWKEAEPNSFDAAVSVDTFEHIPEAEMIQMLKDISRVLKVGGSLLYHANFKQQDIYPMHFDHSEKWDSWLIDAGFAPLSVSHAMKVR
jgi:2-polyprenyl-3-methyl-5-hydroxy-6-metoxy-1,4-benzoquinol methylase